MVVTVGSCLRLPTKRMEDGLGEITTCYKFNACPSYNKTPCPHLFLSEQAFARPLYRLDFLCINFT
jgi:hypothetical protein